MSKEILIQSKKNLWFIDLRELWQYRELLYVLAWRDIAVRYKQTLLGILWAIFQPLLTTGIFTVFFGKIAHIPSDGIPYPLFTFIGLTFWNFFSNGVSAASNSLLANGGIISKIYFPRIIVPLAAIATSGVDFIITFTLLIIGLVIFGRVPQIQSLWLFPLLMLILILFMVGTGFIFAALNIRFRDIRYILPFFIQIGLYVTPIIYPFSVIYDARKYLLALNPLTAVVETARSLIGGAALNWPVIWTGLGVSIIICAIGYYFFRQAEDQFVDIN